MNETTIDIPATRLPGIRAGEPLLARVDRVENGIVHIVVSTPHIADEPPQRSSGAMADLLDFLNDLPRKSGITSEDRQDLRYIDHLRKHAPWYLQKHAPELLA